MKTEPIPDVRVEVGEKAHVFYADHFAWDPDDDILCGSYAASTEVALDIASFQDVPDRDLPRRILVQGRHPGKIKVYVSCLKVVAAQPVTTVATQFWVRVGGDTTPGHPTAVKHLRGAELQSRPDGSVNVYFAWEWPDVAPYGIMLWGTLSDGTQALAPLPLHQELTGWPPIPGVPYGLTATLHLCTLNVSAAVLRAADRRPERRDCFFGDLGLTQREASVLVLQDVTLSPLAGSYEHGFKAEWADVAGETGYRVRIIDRAAREAGWTGVELAADTTSHDWSGSFSPGDNYTVRVERQIGGKWTLYGWAALQP